MKRALFFVAITLAAGSSQAHDMTCEVESRYELRLDRDRVAFSSDEGDALRVEIAGGKLYVDGREATLSQRDRARIGEIAREVQLLAPEVQAIALDAVDIAFIALSEVSRALSEDSDKTIARLAEARREIDRGIRRSPTAVLNEDVIDDAVQSAVQELVPALVGEIVRGAMVAAFTGNTRRVEALEARAAKVEREIERRIEPRAKALEARAEALCDRMVALDGLENQLEYRLPGGDRLDLLRSGRH